MLVRQTLAVSGAKLGRGCFIVEEAFRVLDPGSLGLNPSLPVLNPGSLGLNPSLRVLWRGRRGLSPGFPGVWRGRRDVWPDCANGARPVRALGIVSRRRFQTRPQFCVPAKLPPGAPREVRRWHMVATRCARSRSELGSFRDLTQAGKFRECRTY